MAFKPTQDFPGAPVTNYDSAALENDHVCSDIGKTLKQVVAHNSTGGDLYCQVHDHAAVAAEGSVPKITFLVPAGRSESLDYNDRFSNGIYICNSSTRNTKTIAGDSFKFNVRFD